MTILTAQFNVLKIEVNFKVQELLETFLTQIGSKKLFK